MKQILLLGCVLISFWDYSKAQDSLSLTFEEAVQIGLKSNQTYQISKNELELLRWEKKAAIGAYFPQVNINNSLSQQSGQQFQQVEGEIIVTSVINRGISSGLNVGLSIYNGGRISNSHAASRLLEDAGEHALHRGAQEVVFQVAQQYLQVLLDEELYRLALENLENQSQQLRQITGFVAVGIRTLSDQYNQQSEVARLETVALNAKIQLETDLWQMAEILQLEAGIFPKLAPVQITDPRQNEFTEAEFEGLSDLTYQNRRDYKAQELKELAGKKSLAASRSYFFPQIDAFFNYNTFYTSLDTRSFSDQLLNIYPKMTVGVSVSIPLFNNFRNKFNVAKSRLNLKNGQLELKALKRKLHQETKLAYEYFQAAIKREKATRVQLHAAKEAQLAIQEKFKLGLNNFVDLAQANQQLATAKSDHAQAIYTLYFQEVLMKYTLGITDTIPDEL